MLQKTFLTISVVSLALLTSACATRAPIERVEYVPQIIKQDIPIQARPRPVTMGDVKFYVVNKDNLDKFLEDFGKKNGDIVFIAVSVKDYETLALNLQELKRYIEQQQSVILYYEDALKKDTENGNASGS